jgi:hypothetical protein
MKPGTIFISHRAEYGSVVAELKNAIESTSRGKIHEHLFIHSFVYLGRGLCNR